ncbi:hypothetical protein GCM10010168_49460 [Actinoplanes ianthinogenes]|uniref:Mycothiol-dependent maleylpyruvate isomerase metal-binding domain-containing protein n=1 Tax=Actinoplanes ianthinogenes TaxID=122358 RepID=A0ABN6CLP9_9ACTN|nr:maleylpyruvate isomerase family mycothiol-dependent enzyme [Actinoplanes ianthinogenes]BCJ45998.1 hypothetical protein Aiant_66550 [Actinoplanes ianthinogenes]GGR25585.1 hypothetical protein GCM10010168_49460 [Actinoplanes ianthinogenes]
MNSHEAVAELLGAWALDACPPDEELLVEAHLDSCPACAAEARELREAAASIGGVFLRAPAGSADRLLAAARERRPPATATLGYARAYAAQVAALDLLVHDLAPHEWRRTAAYGELTVHDLLAHLAAVDGLVADALGLPVRPPVRPGEDVAARTDAVLRRERDRPAEETRRSWRAQADAVCRALLTGPEPLTVSLSQPFSLVDAMTARAYETWIHGEDIAVATGRAVVAPLPEHLHPMADLAARMLPRVLTPRPAAVRLHLTGPGGGTWTIPFAPEPVRPAAELAADVVEFCRLAGARRDPSQITVEINGDAALAREFLAAVPTLAPVP